ncbi:DUF397 domain-containing protein [Streptomyces sp. NPDC023723]|uniref:DUF397 domain-containing protein n=1 Tax=Streptomyces sp. NPDC023723 TaxID=3154323 RepID=UPI0033F508E0
MSVFDFVKSSYSNTAGECVEVARNVPGIVAVRDSKGGDGSLILRVEASAWGRFVGSPEL